MASDLNKRINALEKEKEKINNKLLPLYRQQKRIQEEEEKSSRKEYEGRCFTYDASKQNHNLDLEGKIYFKILNANDKEPICMIVVPNKQVDIIGFPLFMPEKISITIRKNEKRIIDVAEEITEKQFIEELDKTIRAFAFFVTDELFTVK